MKNKLPVIVLALLMAGMLWGCGNNSVVNSETTVPTVETTEATIPATVPPDGNPNDVTCKGSYTGETAKEETVARIGEAGLSNGQLQAYYWAEVGAYRASGQMPAPDFSRPLDTQSCELDDSVNSWQQFFLRRALNTWHSTQALILQSQEEGLPVEEAYQPNLKNYDTYLVDIPATKHLYRYEKAFQPNRLHQTYLDQIPDLLAELAGEAGYADGEELAREAFGTDENALAAFIGDYNLGYMYYTNLGYYIENTPEEVEKQYQENKEAYQERGITADMDPYVTFRHILLIPEGKVAEDGRVTCPEEAWAASEKEANELLDHWLRKTLNTEATFGDLANKNSQDQGTALDGGAYRNVKKGQLIEELDAWCFAQEREPEDTGIIRSPYGVHVLYFSGKTEAWYAEAEKDLTAGKQSDLLMLARNAYPMEVDYQTIVLTEASGEFSHDDVLYPDVAHERFPDVPLYLQQDYPSTMFGGFKITTNGCGITTMSMLASYMADDELTPPEMCDRYGRYSFSSGTDGMIFIHEPPVLGFYLQKKTYEYREAYAALEEGYMVVSVQHKGYWTRGGHYILLEKLNEDGTVQVRDSNIYNYGKLAAHKEDKHTWGSIIANGSGFWIFDYKITAIPACSRCGGGENNMLREDYLCHKCAPAVLRRETYLTHNEHT